MSGRADGSLRSQRLKPLSTGHRPVQGGQQDNSAAILNLAKSMQANVVFPLPNLVMVGCRVAATEAGIAASSGPSGGPTSVITYA